MISTYKPHQGAFDEVIDQNGNIAASYQNMFGAANHISQMIKILKDANN